MFDTEIRDCRLQGFLKRAINNSVYYHYTLRTLANCGCYSEQAFGVHLVSNGNATKVLGIRTCNHSWACPYCTARKMSKYAAKISAAIDALYNLHSLVPVMATMTFFHTNQINCNESFQILTRAYTLFDKFGSVKKSKKKNGRLYKNGGAWNTFCTEFNVIHKIKACEITYGQHGWHPHFHNLYFVPKSRLQEVSDYEESIYLAWEKCVDKAVLETLGKERYDIWAFLYSKYKADPANKHKGFNFARDDSGKIKAFTSGDYVCGWGAEDELTGAKLKTAHTGHYTPMEMLQAAYDGNEKMLELYLEFAYTVLNRRQHRVEFSRTGIKKIIIQWQNSEGYKEVLKKKNQAFMEKAKIEPFHLVAWFPSKLWSQISYENDYKSEWLIYLIRTFALYDEGYDLICELMEVFCFDKPFAESPVDACTCYNKLIFGVEDEEELTA